MIQRTIAKLVREASTKFPLVALIGPRQSGKTTLAKALFPSYTYVSLEDLDQRAFAQQDPRGFLSTYHNHCIIDEIQKVPDLFSYLQAKSDEAGMGTYVLTGSQHFLLHKHVSQSLSGRIALLTVLPFSRQELTRANISYDSPEEYVYTGMYPAIYDRAIPPALWYPSYVQTYIERDVRDILRITELSSFQVFIKLCAGRIGQLLNLSSLAQDCGITHNTAKAWISLLETSYIVYLLRPYYNNFSKRLVKMPKLYFYDTGLAAYLLGIQSKDQVSTHYLRGELFENFILTEYLKKKASALAPEEYYFWRDKVGHEIDLLVDGATVVTAIEIKSGKTVTSEYTKHHAYFRRIYADPHKKLRQVVMYAGTQEQTRGNVRIMSWKREIL